MDFPEIKHLLELPALRILRGPNAAMVLGFLYRAFKRRLRVAIPESEINATQGLVSAVFAAAACDEFSSKEHQSLLALDGASPAHGSGA